MNRLQPELGEVVASVTNDTDTFVLLANAAKRYAIPTGAVYINISCTKAGLWVKFGDNAVTAVVGVADVTDGTGSILDPTIRRLDGGVTHVSLINSAACEGSIEWFS